jgi:hypothetical protein
MPDEAPLRETEHGLVPEGDGWFVLNAREARAPGSDGLHVRWASFEHCRLLSRRAAPGTPVADPAKSNPAHPRSLEVRRPGRCSKSPCRRSILGPVRHECQRLRPAGAA